MSTINAHRLEHQLPPLKYFGHWAFDRYLGLEEPASVFFSLGGAVLTLLGLGCEGVVCWPGSKKREMAPLTNVQSQSQYEVMR